MEFSDRVRDKLVDLSDRMDGTQRQREEKKAKEADHGEDADTEQGATDQLSDDTS